MPLLSNCFVQVTHGLAGGSQVLPPATSGSTKAPANVQKLKQAALVNNVYGGKDIFRTVFYRIRVDIPLDPATGLPSAVVPAVGDVAEILTFPSSPFLLGKWIIGRVEPDTGFLPSLLLFVMPYDDMFDTTCFILRSTKTRNSGGEIALTWPATTTTPIKCAVVPSVIGSGSEEPIIASKLQSVNFEYVLLPLGTDVTEVDRIQVGSVIFEVKAVPSSAQSYKFRMWAAVVEVK
jgi:hypothetical protein